MSTAANNRTTSDLSQQIVRELLALEENISIPNDPQANGANNAQEDDNGNEAMPTLSPIPFNAVISTNSGVQRRLSGLTFSSRSRLSICSITSLFSQMDTSESTRSDCSSWCLGRGPLHIALARGSSVDDVSQLLSSSPAVDEDSKNCFTRMRDTDGLTPLHLAMKRGAPNKEATLAALAFDPYVANLQDHLGRTPLHWAMKSGVAPEIIEALLFHGPGAAMTADRKGCLPLHCIEKETSLSSIEKVLNQYPLAVKAKDFDRATPLHKLCLHIVENGGIKSHTQTHLLFAMAGNPDQEEGSGHSPLSILIDDCVSKTDAFVESVEMNFDVLVNWCEQCTVVEERSTRETVDKLTKLSSKLRSLNDTVEQLLSDAYSGRSSRPNILRIPCSRPAKRNFSDGTSESAATVKRKQTRTDNYSVTSSFAPGSISFADFSKDEDTTEATALSTSHGASSSSFYPESSYPNSTATTEVPSIPHAASSASLNDLLNQEISTVPNAEYTTTGSDNTLPTPSIDSEYRHDPAKNSAGREEAQKHNAMFPVRLKDLPDLNTGDETDTEASSVARQPLPFKAWELEAASTVTFDSIDAKVRMYQRQIAREPDMAKKVTLILELYDKEAKNKRMIQADGPIRFMKRVVKISRCFHSCFDGNLENFCAHYKKLDTARFKCAFNQNHVKLKGAEDSTCSIV